MINSNTSSAWEEAYASLIASENINLEYKKEATTAFFNLQKRSITLPTFNYLDDDMSHLLVSHEVAHALYTKYSIEEFEALCKKYKSILNVVEDGYVEKSIKKDFPGLKEVFKRGYLNLFKNGFFGDIEDLSSFNFISRLNLKLKIGHIIDVPFTKEERDIVLKTNNLSSNEDVINLCEEIYQFISSKKEEADELDKNQSSESAETEDTDSSSKSDSTESEVETTEGDMPFDLDDTSEEKESTESKEDTTSEESEEDTTSEESEEDTTSEESEENTSEEEESTDSKDTSDDSKASKESLEDELTDKVQEQLERKLKEYGEEHVEQEKRESSPLVLSSSLYRKDLYDISEMFDDVLEQFPAGRKINNHVTKIKKLASTVNTSFQQNKSAEENKFTKFKTIGRIDRTKLHSFRTSGEIFKQNKILPEGKNHCISIVLDFSGSMYGEKMNSCVTQGLILAEFCKMNDIPFEIIGFGLSFRSIKRKNYTECYLIANNKTFNLKAIVTLFLDKRCIDHYYLTFLSTPLIEGLLSSFAFFRANKNIDKKYVFIITDGDYHIPTELEKDSLDEKGFSPKQALNEYKDNKIIIDNELYSLPNYTFDECGSNQWILEIIMEYMKKHFGVISTIITINSLASLLSFKNKKFSEQFVHDYNKWSYEYTDMSMSYMYKHAIALKEKVKKLPDVSKKEITKYIPSNKKWFDQYINVLDSNFQVKKINKKDINEDSLGDYLKENKLLKELANTFINEIA